MKKIMLAVGVGCVVAGGAIAESPLTTGQMGVMIAPVNNTAAGLRYAVNEKTAVYGLVRNLGGTKNSNEDYSVATQEYEAGSDSDSSELSIAAGIQYFLLGNMYTAFELGIYRYDGTLEFAGSDAREVIEWRGVDSMFSLGYEQPISEMLSAFTSVNYELGSRDITYEEYDANGDLNGSSTRTDRGYSGLSYRLGFTFALN